MSAKILYLVEFLSSDGWVVPSQLLSLKELKVKHALVLISMSMLGAECSFASAHKA